MNPHLSHFQEWLTNCARQYCLTKPWGMTISPLDLAGILSRLEGLIDGPQVDTTKVAVGHKVTLMDHQLQENVSFILVSPEDSEPEHGKLSFLSPLGSALIGLSLGEKVKIPIFGREMSFQVTAIEAVNDLSH